MSYFTDVKCRIKGMVEELQDGDDILAQIQICNVAGIIITLNTLPEKRLYEVVMNQADYSTLNFKGDMLFMEAGDWLCTTTHDSLDSAVEHIASLICANKFL